MTSSATKQRRWMTVVVMWFIVFKALLVTPDSGAAVFLVTPVLIAELRLSVWENPVVWRYDGVTSVNKQRRRDKRATDSASRRPVRVLRSISSKQGPVRQLRGVVVETGLCQDRTVTNFLLLVHFHISWASMASILHVQHWQEGCFPVGRRQTCFWFCTSSVSFLVSDLNHSLLPVLSIYMSLQTSVNGRMVRVNANGWK